MHNIYERLRGYHSLAQIAAAAVVGAGFALAIRAMAASEDFGGFVGLVLLGLVGWVSNLVGDERAAVGRGPFPSSAIGAATLVAIATFLLAVYTAVPGQALAITALLSTAYGLVWAHDAQREPSAPLGWAMWQWGVTALGLASFVLAALVALPAKPLWPSRTCEGDVVLDEELRAGADSSVRIEVRAEDETVCASADHDQGAQLVTIALTTDGGDEDSDFGKDVGPVEAAVREGECAELSAQVIWRYGERDALTRWFGPDGEQGAC